MNRAEHLAWCKTRAMEYANSGDYSGAITSMMSDLRKHPETAHHSGIMIGMMILMDNQINADDVKKFIKGFN